MKIADVKFYNIHLGFLDFWRNRGLLANGKLEYHSAGAGDSIQRISAVLDAEVLPVNGQVTLNPVKPGFGVELKGALLAPFN